MDITLLHNDSSCFNAPLSGFKLILRCCHASSHDSHPSHPVKVVVNSTGCETRTFIDLRCTYLGNLRKFGNATSFNTFALSRFTICQWLLKSPFSGSNTSKAHTILGFLWFSVAWSDKTNDFDPNICHIAHAPGLLPCFFHSQLPTALLFLMSQGCFMFHAIESIESIL